MNQFSFSSGHEVTLPGAISNSRSVVEPYDPEYKFNRLVYSKPNRPMFDIYSIDPLRILQAIDNDDLASLYKITLLGRQIMREHLDSGGVGIWDTLFNSAQQKALTACIFAAGNDYRPLPLSRVAIASQYLNFSMLVSRVQKNQIQPGDKFAVGIYDMRQKLYYVLLYRVDDACQVTMDPPRGRSFLQPAFNLTMEHAVRVEQEGKGSVVDMEDGLEYDAERAGPLVNWVVASVADISEAYPFKPHLTPMSIKKMDVPKLLERLDSEVPNTQPITYHEFKQICRDAYEEARNKKSQNIPAVEVLTTTGNDTIVVKLDADFNPDDISYSFPAEEMMEDSLTESYLNNLDLVGLDLSEVSGIVWLPATDTVAERIVRYFEINY